MFAIMDWNVSVSYIVNAMNKKAVNFWQFRALFAQIFAFWGCSEVHGYHGSLCRQHGSLCDPPQRSDQFKKNKNSFKIDLKRGRFSTVLHNFCTKFCLLRIPWPPRMFKEAAIMSSEVMAFSKSKNSCKNRTKPPKIGRVFVAAIDCFIYNL